MPSARWKRASYALALKQREKAQEAYDSVLVSNAGTLEANGAYSRKKDSRVCGHFVYEQHILYGAGGPTHILEYSSSSLCWRLLEKSQDEEKPLYHGHKGDQQLRAMCENNVSWEICENGGKQPAPIVKEVSMIEEVKALDLLLQELENMARLKTTNISVFTHRVKGVKKAVLRQRSLRPPAPGAEADELGVPLLETELLEHIEKIGEELAILKTEALVVEKEALEDLRLAIAKKPEDLLHAVTAARVKFGIEVTPSTLTSAYYCIFRLRVSYFFLMLLASLTACFSGILMETFFGVFAKSSNSSIGAGTILMFWLLPLGTMALALFGDEVCDLVLDTFDHPSLALLASTILGAIHGTPTIAPSDRLCIGIDLLMLLCFEGVPLAGALLSWKDGTGVSTGYILGGLLGVGIAVAVFTVADLTIAIRDFSFKELKSESGNYRECQVVAAMAMDRNKVGPGQCYLRKACFAVGLPVEGRQSLGDRDAFDHKLYWEQYHLWGGCIAFTFAFGWTFSVIHLWACPATTCTTLFWSHFASPTPAWFAVAFGCVVAVASGSFYLRFPEVVGPFYFAGIVVFGLVSFSLFALSGAQLHVSSEEPIMRVSPQHFPVHPGAAMAALDAYHGAIGDALGGPLPDLSQLADIGLPSSWSGDITLPYLACRQHWGSTTAPVTSLDLAGLSWIAYEADCRKITQLLSQSFSEIRNATHEIQYCKPYSDLPRWTSFYFPSKVEGGEGTRVIAVKGTSTRRDIYTDTDLFSNIKVLQFFSIVTPILSLFPLSLVQWLLKVARINRNSETAIWDSLLQEVKNISKHHPTDKLVFTGHSLGGGIAQIVAAQLRQPAVVFSPPGMVYSAYKFDVDVQIAHRNTFVVMPDLDVVPRVDLQAGIVQHVDCRDKNGSSPLPTECHSLQKTTCELWRVCGDERDFSKACDEYVGQKFLGHMFPQ